MLVIIHNSLGLIISDFQRRSLLTLFAWILIGLVVGYFGSKILNKTDFRLFRYVLLSIIGAMVGGYLAQLLGNPDIKGTSLYSMAVALVGAGVFLIVYHAIFRRRRFLDMS